MITFISRSLAQQIVDTIHKMTPRDGDKGTFLENVPLTPSPRVILFSCN